MSSNIGSNYAVKQCFSVEPQNSDGFKHLVMRFRRQPVGEGTPHVYTSGEGSYQTVLTQMAMDMK